MLKQFANQAKKTTDDALYIHFSSHLLTVLFYTMSKLTTTCSRTYDVEPTVFQLLSEILKCMRAGTKINEDCLVQIQTILGIDQNKYQCFLNLYIQIYQLHMQLKPFLYFYDKHYSPENNDESIAVMEQILAKISLFNSQCITLLANRYADVVKFAKLS